MNSTVSVVIPTHNYGRFIADAIDSVLAQTYPIAEIIVVDDGSTDDTEKVVASFGDKVKYIKQKNAGVCTARNTGVKNSSGDLIAFLDADDIWRHEKVEKQAAKFQEDAQIGLVHCQMREFNTETEETVHLHLDGEEGEVADSLLLYNKIVIIGPGGSILVSRKAFDEVGGFDPQLTVGEDWDFCYRVARKYKVGFVREILVNYRNHGKNSSRNAKEVERSMKICFEKAFDTENENILRFRKEAYGNLYIEIASAYLREKNYTRFGKNLLKGLWFAPENLTRLTTLPLRLIQRRWRLKSHT